MCPLADPLLFVTHRTPVPARRQAASGPNDSARNSDQCKLASRPEGDSLAREATQG